MSIVLYILAVILSVLGISLFIYTIYSFIEALEGDHTPRLRPFLMSILKRLLPKRGYVKLAQMIRKKELDFTRDVPTDVLERSYPLKHLGVSMYEAEITAQTILSVGKSYKLNDTIVKTSTDALKRATKVCEATNDHETIPELLPKIRKAFENMAEFGVSVDEAFVKDSSDMLDRYNKLSEDLRNRTDEERAHDLIAQMQRTHAIPDLDSEARTWY